MLKRLSRIFLIINIKTAIVTAMAVASTFICLNYDIKADFPLTLLATAVVFPIVFSISGAYKRREAALDDYGIIKAHSRAIYLASRDWLENPEQDTLDKAKTHFFDLMSSCRKMFSDPIKNMPENEDEVYRNFSKISKFIKEDLRKKGLASGECSRLNQYLSKMISAFENIKHIYQYRTPRTLSAFSDFFITVLPPLYGPYFAYISQDYSPGLEYAMPVLFSVILVSLDNIQNHLENPFDQIGEDDININAEKLIVKLKLE
ncbi:MAG: hypothetical protein COV36_06315 [Alphaproteobacteria bacterium CG11_big_fil_rev_8_21_14_0_20_44_7]|nr:MAG: hypothetical protein COV36_06315 [Alphaproteobacteria bacterium CG11_big_fil_rev_8_21_14_0_20_44_7]